MPGGYICTIPTDPVRLCQFQIRNEAYPALAKGGGTPFYGLKKYPDDRSSNYKTIKTAGRRESK